MSNTSQKHKSFTAEPMGSKSVNALPGVGNVIGERFKQSGYPMAKNVLGEYLAKNECPSKFQGWMKDQTGANAKQSRDTLEGLREWRQNFL